MNTQTKKTQPTNPQLNFMLGALIGCINQLPEIEKAFIKNLLYQKIRCVDGEHKTPLQTLIKALS